MISERQSEKRMAQKEKGDTLYPTTETGSRLWSNICTLMGVAWAAHIDLGIFRERMITLIRRLEEGDKGVLVLDSIHEETVDEQYKRLFLESALPVAIDNGEEMIVASYGGNHDDEWHPFPKHVTLLHRDANGNEVFGMYEFVLAEEAPKE